MKILIHHHSLAYHNSDGIWIQSFIGAWVDELARHVQTVGLLVHESKLKHINLDYLIKNKNVKMESLGANLGSKNRFSRYFNIKQKVKSINSYSHLIVRGVTPRQSLVLKNSPIKNKHFIFVGCLNDAKENKHFSLKDLQTYFLSKYRIYEMKNLSKIAQFACNSPGTAVELKNKLKINSEYIPTNTISKNYFLNCKAENLDFNRILFVGRVTKDKGIEELIKAVLKLNQSHPDKYQLNIVGPITESYKRYLLKKYDFEKNKINFHGFIPFGQKLMSFYDKSDLYILPSYHEGFPHSIWEAAARRIPVFCTPVGGIPSLLNEASVTFINVKSFQSIVDEIVNIPNNKDQILDKVEILYNIAIKKSLEPSMKELINWISK
jgi:glycosyltransferase involved in cell wall biosynthesis